MVGRGSGGTPTGGCKRGRHRPYAELDLAQRDRRVPTHHRGNWSGPATPPLKDCFAATESPWPPQDLGSLQAPPRSSPSQDSISDLRGAPTRPPLVGREKGIGREKKKRRTRLLTWRSTVGLPPPMAPVKSRRRRMRRPPHRT